MNEDITAILCFLLWGVIAAIATHFSNKSLYKKYFGKDNKCPCDSCKFIRMYKKELQKK